MDTVNAATAELPPGSCGKLTQGRRIIRCHTWAQATSRIFKGTRTGIAIGATLTLHLETSQVRQTSPSAQTMANDTSTHNRRFADLECPGNKLWPEYSACGVWVARGLCPSEIRGYFASRLQATSASNTAGQVEVILALIQRSHSAAARMVVLWNPVIVCL